ncbi:MAG: non-heme iron oxygenase ferredoxin subunit [Dehalococcoidia bacterium]|jgi:3-phenylpropionate/trans-cinnamate dioxygenase ferredoxin subunit
MFDVVNAMATSDVPPGTVKVVELKGRRIAVCNVGGEFFAVDDVCTHDGGPLGNGRLCDGEIECPRHGGRFDVRSGRATVFPAINAIRTYPVSLHEGNVTLSLPEEAGERNV